MTLKYCKFRNFCVHLLLWLLNYENNSEINYYDYTGNADKQINWLCEKT